MSFKPLATIPAFLVVLAVAASAQIPGMPQPPAQPSGPSNGVIVGQVLDGDSNRPVAGAMVMLNMAPPGVANAAVGGGNIPMDALMSLDISNVIAGVRQAITDGQGQFAFTGLARGTFSLQANKGGWSGGGFGQLRADGTPAPLTLAGDARMGAVTLKLWKNAALSGTVLDEAGEPIIGIGVRALRRTWLAGRSRFTIAGSGQTDDRGVYRVGALRPGDYIVVIAQTAATMTASGGGMGPDPAMIQSLISGAGSNPDPNAMLANMAALMAGGPGGGIRRGDWILQTSTFGGRLVPPTTSADGRMLAYRTTFYPAASTAAQATAVAVRSGEERGGVDFQLRPVTVVDVTGTVSGADGSLASLPIRLVPAGSDDLASDAGFEGATTMTNASGAFTFLAVPPGQYTLRAVRTPRPNMAAMAQSMGLNAPAMIQNAQGGRAMSMGAMTMDMMMPIPPPIPAEPTLWASMPVSIGETDIAGLDVPLRIGLRVSGRAEFEGSAARPAPDRLQRIPIVLERADAVGAPASPLAGLGAQQGQGGQFNERGEFTTYGVAAGKYYVRVPFSFSGWTLKSAEFGGRDVADVPLELEDGDVTGVVLRFTDRATDLSGVVRNQQSTTSTGATVVVAPAQPEMWVDFGTSPRRVRTAKTAADGRYQIGGLPPGDYLIAAVPGEAGSDWQNPTYLRTLAAAATKITIGDGEKKTMDLVVTR
jgi:protocatechuate 3,4-dioxygenase beta subunit